MSPVRLWQIEPATRHRILTIAECARTAKRITARTEEDWKLNFSLSSHLAAEVCAGLAGGNTLVHSADPFTVRGALGADFCSLPPCVPVMRGIDQHEMSRCTADFRTGHHHRKCAGSTCFPRPLDSDSSRSKGRFCSSSGTSRCSGPYPRSC